MGKKTNPKVLGGQFEREISRLLSAWILGKDINNPDEIKNTKLVVWRVGSSGAVATISNQIKLHGDIVPIDEIAIPVLEKFNFEVKRRKNFNLFSVLSRPNKKQEFLSWFEQADIEGYQPIFIFKVLRVGWYAVIDTLLLYDLIEFCGNPPESIKLKFKEKTLFIFELTKFLNWSYNYIKMLQDLWKTTKNN